MQSPSLQFPFPAPPAPGETIEVAPDVLWLRMPLPFALDHINLWLLREPGGFALVDCGYGDAPTRALWQRHFERTLAGRPLTRIVVTHYHPDHLGNAAWLAERFGCGISMTLGEYFTGHAIANQTSGFGLRATVALFGRHGMPKQDLEALEARGNHYARGVPTLPSSFHRLLDGEWHAIGPARWRVIEGLGHSPEHASLHAPDLGLLISGDMLLPKISTNVSVWPTEPDADVLGRFLHSIRTFDALPADTLVLPSHGLPFRGIGERIRQLDEHHDARLAEVEAAVVEAGGTVSAAEAVPLLFRRALDLQQQFFAMGEAIAHLNRLWHTGRLERLDAEGRWRFALAATGR